MIDEMKDLQVPYLINKGYVMIVIIILNFCSSFSVNIKLDFLFLACFLLEFFDAYIFVFCLQSSPKRGRSPTRSLSPSRFARSRSPSPFRRSVSPRRVY